MVRRVSLFSFLLLGIAMSVMAQDNIPVRALQSQIFRTINKDDKDTVKWKWKFGGTSNLNLSQTSLSNWAAGGEKFSMSIRAVQNLYLFHKWGKHTWDNNLDYRFGYIQTSSMGGQKNDDYFDFVSKYGLQMDSSKKWYASILFNPQTQLFDGRSYYNRDSSTLSSTFLSPGYVTLAIGFDYKPFPKKNFSIFFSPITSRTTLVMKRSLAATGSFGVDPYHRYMEQFGAFSMITFNGSIMKNVDYSGKLNLFSNYLERPKNVTLYCTNMLNFKINRLLSANYSLNLIYDDDVKLFGPNGNSPALQVMSAIGIGFSFPIRASYVRI
ncbi:MAG: hypothetical protein DI598_00710 [Pseudopedobacter saltans]|uniref:DUF3078 domain-containing protein n=1 Tax=Pseudopedobacter saltans TaxID=151895 RepID=A0A2W5F8N7_9SPHI|nr:MAG: hypothetical protein DI598_00710 [Pseudopedobacter saltans]